MNKSTVFKLIFVVVAVIYGSVNLYGQATLPVSAPFTNLVSGTSPGTMPSGFTQSGLGGYNGALKFGPQGSWLKLNFSSMPGTLSFDLRVNSSLSEVIPTGCVFTLQESVDGVTWTDVDTYTNVTGGGVKTITSLNSGSRYLRWYFTTRSGGASFALRNITLLSNVTVTPATLGNFTYIIDKGPSSEQSFTVSGYALTNDISIVSPADYEISTTSGSSFLATNPIVLTQAGGIVNNTTIYSRLKEGLSVNAYNENISIATDTYTRTISCIGNVTPIPTLRITDLTDPVLNTSVGSPVSQTMNVSAVNLSHNLGLSLSGSDAGLFSLSQNEVSLNNGSVPNTLVTITYLPVTAGNHTATLKMSSSGAMDVTRNLNGVASIVTGLNVEQKSLNISVQNNNVIFTSESGEILEIYNSIGQLLVREQTIEGLNEIPISAHGVILIKVGRKLAKVLLK